MNTQDELNRLDDDEIARYFREAAIERGRSGFNWRLGNRIFAEKILPAYKVLAARGPLSLRKLLPLTEDPDPFVRKDAAILAYDVNPARCRVALKGMVDEPGWVGIMALIGLIHKDPEYAAEFEHSAATQPGPPRRPN